MSLTILPTSYVNNQSKTFGIRQEIDRDTFLPLQLTGGGVWGGTVPPVAVVNALRRIFIAEVETYAFTPELTELHHTSQYHQDVLLDRIGLITVSMDYIEKSGIPYQELEFKVCDHTDHKKPLRNTTQRIKMVSLHQDLEVYHRTKRIPTAEICPYDSLLLHLNPNEEIHAVMKLAMGLGITHPRWQSSITMYKFGTENDPSDKVESCQEQLKYIGYQTKKPEKIILTIETIGKLASYKVVKRGIRVLHQKLMTIRNQLTSGSQSAKISTEQDAKLPNFIKVKIVEETHTLGRVLEYLCLTKMKELITTTVEKYLITHEPEMSAKFEEMWTTRAVKEAGESATVKKTAMNQWIKDTTNDEMLKLLQGTLSGYRKIHPTDDYIELILRVPELLFPDRYEELPPTLRVLALALDEGINACEKLTQEADQLFPE